MTTTFATIDDLTARLSSAYTVPDNALQLLEKASELIDFATLGRCQHAWDWDPTSSRSMAITNAVCDQVEFWMEVGEEHDVAGLHGSLQGGRVQVNQLPGYLGQRALRTLLSAGLYYSGAAIM